MDPQHRIDVWEIDFPEPQAPLPVFGQCLRKNELERMALLRNPEERAKYGITRIALRNILSRYTGKNPNDIEFSQNEFGKPRIESPPPYFNLSHTAGKAAIAVSMGIEMGIDLENSREQRDFRSIAKRFFSEREKAAVLGAGTPENERETFYAIWTRKEAFIKALGKGLSYPLASFSVDSVCSCRESAVELAGGNTGEWKNISFSLNRGYIGALAVRNRRLSVVFLDWSLPTG